MRLIRLLLSLSVLLSGIAAEAQHPAAVPTRVLVTITDKSGYPPEVDLKDRLGVREDNILQKIDDVKPAADIPIHLAIFMDESGRFAQYKNDEQQAATAFLERFVRKGVDKPYMLAFGQGTSSMNSIHDYADYKAARSNINVASGEAILDGMQAFVGAVNKQFGEKFPDRRAVIIFSNGGAQVSVDELERLRNYALANRITLYEVDTDWTQRANYFGSATSELIESTGGSIERPNNVKQFADSLNQMGAHIRNQYEVTYETTHPDGKLHSLKIRALDKNLVVQGPTSHLSPLGTR